VKEERIVASSLGKNNQVKRTTITLAAKIEGGSKENRKKRKRLQTGKKTAKVSFWDFVGGGEKHSFKRNTCRRKKKKKGKGPGFVASVNELVDREGH